MAGIIALAKEVMLQSAAYYSLYPDEFNPVNLEELIDDLLHWFRNNALEDTIFRVGHDRPRKPGPDDRNSDNKVKE